MPKFCTKCGRPLEEGEVCNCQAEKKVEVTPEQPAPEVPQGQPNPAMNQGQPNQGMPNQGMPQGQPYQGMPNQGMPQGQPYQGQPYQAMPQAQPSQVGIFFKNAFAGFLAILKQPVAMGKSFVQSMDFKMSALFIAIQAILVALFGIICAGKLMTYLVNGVSAIASELVGYGSMLGLYGSMIKIPYAKAFFGTLFMSIIFSVALAGIFLLGNMILKNQVNFQMMLCVVAVRSVLLAPVIVVAIIVSLINPMVGILVFFGANIWAIMVMAQIIPVYSEKAAQFMSLVLFICQLLFMLIALFVMTKCSGFYIPDF